MLVGLGGGLALARPLSGWLQSDLLGQVKTLSNPFSAWVDTDQDLVVMGSDVGGGNTDVIFTVRVRNGQTQITQIPRDTYIESARFGGLKANALYAYGGTEAVKEELSYHLGRPVGHYLVVNLGAIRRMGDVLGGVEVNVPKRMYYVDNSQGLSIDLQPGLQTLKGRDLEGFLRWRHDEEGDIGRIDRQKLVLEALFRKLIQPHNLVRLPSLLSAAGKDFKTDLGPMEIGGLLTAMAATNLTTERLDGHPFDLNGISYWEAVWPQADGVSPAANGSGPREGDTRDAKSSDQRFRFLF
jgi:LCP family protein required for cell wall assembly